MRLGPHGGNLLCMVSDLVRLGGMSAWSEYKGRIMRADTPVYHSDETIR